MKSLVIVGKVRSNLGKKASKILRKEELIPCVLYGGGENVHFAAHEKEFRHLVYSPEVATVELDLEGKIRKAVLHDIQFHPVSDKILHVDFYEIFDDKKVEIGVPVKLHGFSEGVKQGGKLFLERRKLKIKALLKDLPDIIDIDITNLEVGKSIRISDLKMPNVEFLDPKNNTVVSVKITRAVKETEGGTEGATAGKPEEKKK